MSTKFLGSLHFPETLSQTDEARAFYKLIRSKTPSGQKIVEIISRPPVDDPSREFNYRLNPVKSTIVAKQNMPFALSDERMKLWNEFFLSNDFEVTTLLSYEPELA